MRNSVLFSAILAITTLIAIGCKESTDGTVQTTDPATPSNSPDVTPISFANAKCPIMGGKPTEELTTEYQGETIGFCCEGCPEKWAELSDEQKAEKFAKVRVEDE